ncbi:hypothetical protein UG55_1010109 [Frankia sp. EI5c]|uniref:hypothetical protein n=1 Tax=Frankia sp. EI5c TaxID=683316 RepID=UPI0007C266B7|nr:hypothetical protein [Frankia sp. EI5c]OAA27093.1 hypothetical protein UG55_1010109 [Frankia sp. EI5c]
MRRILFRPSWVARHVLALFLVGLFLRMGIWQWTKGESDHGTLQNLFYGVEWPIFAAFVVYWWWRMVSEDLHPRDSGEDPGPQWGQGGRIAPEGPALHTRADSDAGAGAETDEDGELAAYNRYLASLYERDAAGQANNAKGANR